MKLTVEGEMIAERLRFLDQKIRDARVLSAVSTKDEMEALRKKAASEAVRYCKRKGLSYWDFLKEVGI